MSKAVMISIRPEWCELIANGKKTIEARKTRPKLETPFKCYIYCTKPKGRYDWGLCRDNLGVGLFSGCNYEYAKGHEMDILSGMVIGEFVCDGIYAVLAHPSIFAGHELFFAEAIKDACLTEDEVSLYSGGKDVLGWHISDLVIYDKPLPLSWFVTEGDCDCMNCRRCSWFNRGNGYNVEDDCDLGYESIRMKKSLKPLFRPPQSWCYVEEL